MEITTKQYMEYIQFVAESIAAQRDYITELDAKLGDGDHWLNLNNGFKKILQRTDEFKEIADFSKFFKQLARAIMTDMGGTSGALYGSMYLAAAQQIGEVRELKIGDLANILLCWADAIMRRGNTEPGQKTMLDTILPAAREFDQAVKMGKTEAESLRILKDAAWNGAESTKMMKAMRGRASNQPGYGVGHLDPGAVTMAIQLDCLSKYLSGVNA